MNKLKISNEFRDAQLDRDIYLSTSVISPTLFTTNASKSTIQHD